MAKKRKKRIVTMAKAKKIMREGMVRGHELSESQRGLFGLIAGGGKPTRMNVR